MVVSLAVVQEGTEGDKAAVKVSQTELKVWDTCTLELQVA